MNKVGIMTFHKSINYGSVLQAYALQKAIAKMGYQVEIIDYEPDNYKYLYGYFRMPTSGNNIKFNLLNLSKVRLLKRRKRLFEAFRKNFLALSSNNYKYGDNLESLNQFYDVLVCGSDQIWNPKAKDCDENFFLPILHKTTKISYAVSLNDGFLADFYDAEKYRDYLLDFDSISVREESGKKDIGDFLDNEKDVTVVLDPTLLHQKEDYEEICEERIVGEPYLFFYSVNHNQATIHAVANLAKRLKLPVYYLYTNISSHRTMKQHPEFHCMKHHVAPQDFISLIKYADYVVTDSFHGTAFSVIFEKNFYAIGKTGAKGEAICDERICNLLSKLAIEQRFISEKDAITLPLEKIEYEVVNQKRKELILDSNQFLKDALTKGADR